MAPAYSAPPAGEEWVRAGKTIGRDAKIPLLIELVALGVISPVYFFLVLPASVAINLINYLFIRPKTTIRSKPSAETEQVNIPSGKDIPFAQRKYDVILLGATGFTGGLAAKYLGKQYEGGKVKWAIAGRRREALEKVRDALPNPADADIIVVDTAKEETLHELVYNTRSVATTVGPFALYGTQVVRYCAHYGTHYCDITGEVDWVEETIDRFDVTAKKSGARIVHCCGHDSVPWDISTLGVVEEARKKDPTAQLKSVVHLNRIVAAPSGGTLATVFNAVYGTDKYTTSLPHNALLNTAEQTKSAFALKLAPVFFRRSHGLWQSMAPMAIANAGVAKRSNALLGYGKAVRYEEGQVANNALAALCSVLEVFAFIAVVACPPLLALAKAYVLPKPGQGPSEKFMDHKGFLHVTTKAEFESGSKVKTATSTMFFKTDPGYRDTARMLVESALTLALSKEGDLPGTPGVHTPASGIGMGLLERLCNTGTTYHVTSE